MRPRVWFGERWITSIFDLFEENVRYFPSLLPITEDEDPVEVLERGDVPKLAELRLHNGTIYRWNRPIYDVVTRAGRTCGSRTACLPAGPTVVDVLANAAFYFGLVKVLAEQRASGVVADVVLGRGGELPQRRQERHRRARLLAGPRRGPRDRAGAAPAAADGARGPAGVGRRRRRP